MNRCPGSDQRDIKVDDVLCTSCGAAVELFSDESKRRCPKCGARVERDATPACAAWCPAAAECLGAQRYRAFLETTGEPTDADGEPDEAR